MIILFLVRRCEKINSKSRNELTKLNGESQKVIFNIIKDGLIYLLNRIEKLENKDIIKNLTLFYFNLIGENEKQLVTYEQLTIKEKRIFLNIMVEGITDVILDNQYLNTIYLTKQDKEEIINEITMFISNITEIAECKVKRKIKLNLKKERKNALL